MRVHDAKWASRPFCPVLDPYSYRRLHPESACSVPSSRLASVWPERPLRCHRDRREASGSTDIRPHFLFARGSPEAVRQSEVVQAVYLGTESDLLVEPELTQ
jgi:hypothetical protein